MRRLTRSRSESTTTRKLPLRDETYSDLRLHLDTRLSCYKQTLALLENHVLKAADSTPEARLEATNEQLETVYQVEMSLSNLQSSTLVKLRRYSDESSTSDETADPSDPSQLEMTATPVLKVEDIQKTVNELKERYTSDLIKLIHRRKWQLTQCIKQSERTVDPISDAGELKEAIDDRDNNRLALRDLLHRRYAGNNTLAHFAAINDDRVLLQNAVDARLDFSTKNSLQHCALFYAFENPEMFLCMLTTKPDTSQLRHSSGQLMNTYATQALHELPCHERESIQLYRSYQSASNLKNKNFFGTMLSDYFNYLKTLQQYQASIEKHGHNHDGKSEASEVGYNVLLTGTIIDSLAKSLQGTLRQLFVDENVLGIQINKHALQKTLEEINRFYEKHNSPDAIDPNIAKTEKNQLLLLTRFNIKSIYFLECYHEMLEAINAKFPSWKVDLHGQLETQVRVAKQAYATDQFKALTALFSKKYQLLSAPGFQQYYRNNLAGILKNESPTKAIVNYREFIRLMDTSQNKIDMTAFRSQFANIAYIVGLLPMKEREQLVEGWLKSLTVVPAELAKPGDRHSAPTTPLSKSMEKVLKCISADSTPAPRARADSLPNPLRTEAVTPPYRVLSMHS